MRVQISSFPVLNMNVADVWKQSHLSTWKILSSETGGKRKHHFSSKTWADFLDCFGLTENVASPPSVRTLCGSLRSEEAASFTRVCLGTSPCRAAGPRLTPEWQAVCPQSSRPNRRLVQPCSKYYHQALASVKLFSWRKNTISHFQR